MNRPLPAHGTYARFVGRPAANIPGCRCDLCKPEGQRYIKRRDYLEDIGRPLSVGPKPSQDRINMLIRSGGTLSAIAKACKRDENTLRRIASGRAKKVWRSTEQRLLALQVQDVTSTPYKPAIGAIRKVRALRAIGHTSPELAERCPLSLHALSNLAAGSVVQVRERTAVEVDKLYAQLAMVPGSCQFTITMARRRNWAPPLAWDEDTIDDPGAEPDWTGACGTRHGFELHTVRPNLPAPCPRCVIAQENYLARESRLAA